MENNIIDDDYINYSYNAYNTRDRIRDLSGDNPDVEEIIRRNIVAVDKAKQDLDGGLVLIAFLCIAVGCGSRIIVWGGNAGSFPIGFCIALVTSVILVIINRLTKGLQYGKLRDMIGAWYMFAQTGLLLSASFSQAYYYGLKLTESFDTALIALFTWIVAVVVIVVAISSSKKANVEYNPFYMVSLKKAFEWDRIRKQRDKAYRILRDIFYIPLIYSCLKFAACFITDLIIQIGGENNDSLGDSINRLLRTVSYIDWGLFGVFAVIAIGYSIRFFASKEHEKETTEYIDINSTIFEEDKPKY
ncbi:MAG: hypothetical protein J5819_04745 [Eubacterium sp.]|nr:hypothetical protein [Eubacterium sp.]